MFHDYLQLLVINSFVLHQVLDAVNHIYFQFNYKTVACDAVIVLIRSRLQWYYIMITSESYFWLTN